MNHFLLIGASFLFGVLVNAATNNAISNVLDNGIVGKILNFISSALPLTIASKLNKGILN